MRMPDNSEPPSPEAIRPWGLRGMHVLPRTGTQITDWCYDHERQIAVDSEGRPLKDTRMGPTANKVTSGDGDEGPSEDFTYDFAPDTSYPPA
ncbi:MAG: putative ATP-grasp-modified RiPP [Pseudonocardiaceae bacterium]